MTESSETESRNSYPHRRGCVVGMFDGVHRGHRYLLDTLREECARRGLYPAVMTFPRHPLSEIAPEKAPGLLSTPAEKLTLLERAGIRREDIGFMVFDCSTRRLTAAEFMRMLHERYHVDFLLRGFNNRFGCDRSLTDEDYRRIAREEGIELIEGIGLTEGEERRAICSTLIRQALAKGDIAEANRLAGYPYPLTGRVVGGKHLGRTIGFPTANIVVDDSCKLIPADGVYIVTVTVEGVEPPAEGVKPPAGEPFFRGMVNIGTRPTVDGLNTRRTIEAHIIGFDGDIYGREVTLRFHRRLRGEIRFPSLDALTEQLVSDREAVMMWRPDSSDFGD